MLTIVYGVLVIGGICLVALGRFILVERLVPAESRQSHNDVAGFIYAALGVIYAVLLALVVIAVWERSTGRPMRRSSRRPTPWPRSSGWVIGFLSQKVLTSRSSPTPTPRR
jgi:membrane-bound ClpP family serine protease